MNRIRFGIVAGIIFGVLDVLPMLGMQFSNRVIAMAGAFTSCFAIGFLTPQVRMQIPEWLTGIIVGFLVSLPGAIVTGAYLPILPTAVVGGAVIGWLVGGRAKKSAEENGDRTFGTR